MAGRDSEKPQPAGPKTAQRGDSPAMSRLAGQCQYLTAARKLPPDDAAWLPLMRDVLQLPLWMLPAVRLVMRTGPWTRAKDPIASVRGSAERAAIRMRLTKPSESAEKQIPGTAFAATLNNNLPIDESLG
jgi:hypothetical protein